LSRSDHEFLGVDDEDKRSPTIAAIGTLMGILISTILAGFDWLVMIVAVPIGIVVGLIGGVILSCTTPARSWAKVLAWCYGPPFTFALIMVATQGIDVVMNPIMTASIHILFSASAIYYYMFR